MEENNAEDTKPVNIVLEVQDGVIDIHEIFNRVDKSLEGIGKNE